jgi:hypothetical protein
MTKYLITATRTSLFTIEVEADNPGEAYECLDGWIADDFDPYARTHKWDFEIEEN